MNELKDAIRREYRRCVTDGYRAPHRGGPQMASWKRETLTRSNTLGVEQRFVTYTNEAYPGYRIEKWDATTWAWFLGDTICSTRTTLTAVKRAVAEDYELTREG